MRRSGAANSGKRRGHTAFAGCLGTVGSVDPVMGTHSIVLRSSATVRGLLTCFFAFVGLLFVWAAVSRTPGSLASQWTGHVLFGLAALGSMFMAARGFRSGYLEITDSEIRFSRIRGRGVECISDVASVDQGPDWRSYAIAPILRLTNGRSVRLSDFGSSTRALMRHPTTCACGRARRALELAIGQPPGGR